MIDAVAKGEADIGFVAYAPSRTGTVEFSQTYMLVRQSFLVPEASALKSVNDIDKSGLRISGGKGDSVTLFLARTLKTATLVETDNTPADTKRKFDAGEIDAFAANRQRLTNMMKDMPGYRILPDNVFDVPQTIIVAKGNAKGLATVNGLIDDVRRSGFLKRRAGEERHPRHRRRARRLRLRTRRIGYDPESANRLSDQLMPKLEFYFAPGTSSMAPHIALHEIGVPFEARPLSFATNEQRDAAFSRDQSGRQGAGARRRRSAADRGRGDPVLSREAISRRRRCCRRTTSRPRRR